jgi:hypothetical protein
LDDDFRVVFYDKLNGYFRMSPSGHETEAEAIQYAEAIRKKTTKREIVVFAIVKMVKGYEDD